MANRENIDRTIEAEDAPAPDSDRKPDSPPHLDKSSWRYGLTRAVQEFVSDRGTDLAAMLTYFTVLSLAPSLLVIFSLITLVLSSNASSVTTAVEDFVSANVPDDYQSLVMDLVTSVSGSASGGIIALIVGIATALWAASAYVKAFARSSNIIYEREEGRGFVKKTGTMLLTTLAIFVGAVLILVSIALNETIVDGLLGPVAEPLGLTSVLNFLTSTFLPIWAWIKWPVILALVIVIIAVLYYFTPNVRMPKFKWVTIGSAVAILGIIIAAIALYFYFSSFASYSSYGAIGSVMALLFALWIFNIMILLGLEIDAEVERARQLQSGIEAEDSIQLPPRDTKKVYKQREKQDELIRDGRDLRESAASEPSDGESTRSADLGGAKPADESRGGSRPAP